MNEQPNRYKANATPDANAKQVRIALLNQGHTLHSWARAHGFPYSTVWRTAHRGGRRRSSRAIIAALLTDLSQTNQDDK